MRVPPARLSCTPVAANGRRFLLRFAVVRYRRLRSPLACEEQLRRQKGSRRNHRAAAALPRVAASQELTQTSYITLPLRYDRSVTESLPIVETSATTNWECAMPSMM